MRPLSARSIVSNSSPAPWPTPTAHRQSRAPLPPYLKAAANVEGRHIHRLYVSLHARHRMHHLRIRVLHNTDDDPRNMRTIVTNAACAPHSKREVNRRLIPSLQWRRATPVLA